MPYGFIRHIEEEGYKSETIKSYEKVVSQFYTFINSKYPNSKEPFQISNKDINDYLEDQLKNNKSVSTINKELAIIKTMFNYFWKKDFLTLDPAMKIKRLKKKEVTKVDLPYESIINLIEPVLNNQSYSESRKSIFILATKGLKTSEFRFQKSDIVENTNDNSVLIKLRNREITLNGKEAETFLYYLDSIRLQESNYVFTTKKQGEQQITTPVEVMTILSHLRSISEDYKHLITQPLTLIMIRRAYASYLYSKKVPIQKIAAELGIKETSASNYLKLLSTEAK